MNGLWTGLPGLAAEAAGLERPRPAPAPAVPPAQPTSTVNAGRFRRRWKGPAAAVGQGRLRQVQGRRRRRGRERAADALQQLLPLRQCPARSPPPSRGTCTSRPKTEVGIVMQIDTQMRLIHSAEHPADLKLPACTAIRSAAGRATHPGHRHHRLRRPGPVQRRHHPRPEAARGRALPGWIDGGKTLEKKTYTFTDPDAFTGPYTIVRKSFRTESRSRNT